jgi:hypothetical protein
MGLSQSTLTKLAEKPRSTLRSLVTDPDQQGELNKVVQSLRRLEERGETTGAIEAVKGVMRDEVDRYFRGMEPEQIIRMSTEGKLHEMVSGMQGAGLISREVGDQILSEIRRTQTIKQRTKSLKDLDLPNNNEALDSISSGIAAVVAQFMGGTQSLLVGGVIRRNIKRRLAAFGWKPAEVEALEEMMLTPETYINRIENLDALVTEGAERSSPQVIADAIFYPLDRLNRPGQAASAAMDVVEEED